MAVLDQDGPHNFRDLDTINGLTRGVSCSKEGDVMTTCEA